MYTYVCIRTGDEPDRTSGSRAVCARDTRICDPEQDATQSIVSSPIIRLHPHK